MLERFRRSGFATLRDDWMALDAYAGRAIVLQLPDTRGVHGVAAGVDETGAFLLRDHDGRLKAFSGGEATADQRK